jgi:hypothetical protein
MSKVDADAHYAVDENAVILAIDHLFLINL